MIRKDFTFTAYPDIITKRELEQRESNRPYPVSAPALVPKGAIARDVVHVIHRQSEDRIDHLKERLGAARAKLREGRALGLERGKPASAFERNR